MKKKERGECESKERAELVRLLLELAKSTPVRLCVSSRPWSDLEKAFDGWPRLRLPENNAWNIFQLICRRLESANADTFRNIVDDIALFEFTCARKRPHLPYAVRVKYKYDQNSLTPPQRLIHDLSAKGDGNLLWVTAVLDPICERLRNGQTVTKVMPYIDDLPADVEDYYYDLVYARIHSTYRTGDVSECAMALKIIGELNHSYDTSVDRFELIWALQTSLGTGSGVASDPNFFTKPPSLIATEWRDQEAYEAVSAFVGSRCKDLLVTSRSSGTREDKLEYQHRVIHDFLASERMQALVNAAVPKHFQVTQFRFHLGLHAAWRLYEHHVYLLSGKEEGYRRDYYSYQALVRLQYCLQQYLENIEDAVDERILQTCDEMAVASHRLLTGGALASLDARDNRGELLTILEDLVRAQQFGLLSDIIRNGSAQNLQYIILAYVKEDKPLHGHCWLGDAPSFVRRAVSINKSHIWDTSFAPHRTTPCYLPCVDSLWTEFLLDAYRDVRGKRSGAPLALRGQIDRNKLLPVCPESVPLYLSP